MASFSDIAAAETRCKAQIVAGTWINAHVARDFIGMIKGTQGPLKIALTGVRGMTSEEIWCSHL